MKTEIFTLCDFAAVYAGKLTIVGAFDSVYVKQAPAIIPQCALAVRLRCEKRDIGQHDLKVTIVDASGKSLCTLGETKLQVAVPEVAPSISLDLSVAISSMNISQIGVYAVQLNVDSRLVAEIPLHVYQVKA